MKQEIYSGKMVSIFKANISNLTITRDGLIYAGGHKGELKYNGCLPAATLKDQKKAMQTNSQREHEETLRVVAKNSLEKILREARGEEVGLNLLKPDYYGSLL